MHPVWICKFDFTYNFKSLMYVQFGQAYYRILYACIKATTTVSFLF